MNSPGTFGGYNEIPLTKCLLYAKHRINQTQRANIEPCMPSRSWITISLWPKVKITMNLNYRNINSMWWHNSVLLPSGDWGRRITMSSSSACTTKWDLVAKSIKKSIANKLHENSMYRNWQPGYKILIVTSNLEKKLKQIKGPGDAKEGDREGRAEIKAMGLKGERRESQRCV